LQVPPGVPGQGRDPVAELDALLLEPLCHLQGARSDLAVGGAVDRSLDRAGHDLAVAVLDRGVIDDAMAQQRPVLHQSLHRPLLRECCWFFKSLSRILWALAGATSSPNVRVVNGYWQASPRVSRSRAAARRRAVPAARAGWARSRPRPRCCRPRAPPRGRARY